MVAWCKLYVMKCSCAAGVRENNSKNTIADPFSGATIAAIGALGLGKLISANMTSHLASVDKSNGVCTALGKYMCAEGSD